MQGAAGEFWCGNITHTEGQWGMLVWEHHPCRGAMGSAGVGAPPMQGNRGVLPSPQRHIKPPLIRKHNAYARVTSSFVRPETSKPSGDLLGGLNMKNVRMK